MKIPYSILTATALCAMAQPAWAQAELKATLTAANEVPGPGEPKGSGGATIELDGAKQQVCFKLWSKGTDAPTMAHIHKGAAGVAGPVVVALDPPTAAPASGCKPADAALIAAIAAAPGDYYVNVHTAAFPKGALRGQLVPATK